MSLEFTSTEFLKLSNLDSFYSSRVVVCLENSKIQRCIRDIFSEYGFINVDVVENKDKLVNHIKTEKYDLLIIEMSADGEFVESDLHFLNEIRSQDVDVAVLTISSAKLQPKDLLEYSVSAHFPLEICEDDLIKAAKKALGEKISHEIGMQFFDALFGMQMCTHKELHQHTFDHVIRTTKIYAKFLLDLKRKNYFKLTSWSLKNCLMASLVHDLGKLMVVPQVLYKDGPLSGFEFKEIKRHPWHSITALLGGQDISHYAEKNIPLAKITGYNEKNLSEQAKKWILEINENDSLTMDNVEAFFGEMHQQPFVHSLNRDLLYIVFRHHDGINHSYHSDKDLKLFAKVIGTDVKKDLNPDSLLDIVTNALSLCDMYDALMDANRYYHKVRYSRFCTLFLLYAEKEKKKFFPELFKYFVEFIIKEDMLESDGLLFCKGDAGCVYETIKALYKYFRITKEQEPEFNEFLLKYGDDIYEYVKESDEKSLRELNSVWINFYDKKRKGFFNGFIEKLKKYNLIEKEIDQFSLNEIKTFDKLYKFYNSYNSVIIQKKIMQYLIKSVSKPLLNKAVKKRMIKILKSDEITDWNKMNSAFFAKAYDRRDLLGYFSLLNEEEIIYDFNEYLRKN